MTNEQILKKAIEKAIKNGWKPIKVENNRRLEFDVMSGNVYFYTNKKYSRRHKNQSSYRTVHSLSINDIIFSHDFAKAFWGEKKIQTSLNPYWVGITWWEYYLQKMVLEEEPLKYLEKFLT